MTETTLAPTKAKAEPEVLPVKTKSKGEKFFDRFVYGGIAALGTFVVTVPVTFLLKHHARVAPHFERVVDGLHRLLGKTSIGFKRETADTIVTTAALMQGGNLMLLPIGALEKHKVAIVSGLNTALGDPTPAEQIEKSPKQTWWSLIESRMVAFVAVFSAFKGAEMFVPNTLKTFEDEVGTRMCQWFNKPKERNVLGALAKSKTYIFGKIGALDFFATIAAATLLYVGGHFFARKQEEKYEQKVQRKGSAPTTHLDAVESAVPVMMGAQTPALHVEGERHHEGRALAEPMAATQR